MKNDFTDRTTYIKTVGDGLFRNGEQIRYGYRKYTLYGSLAKLKHRRNQTVS